MILLCSASYAQNAQIMTPLELKEKLPTTEEIVKLINYGDLDEADKKINEVLYVKSESSLAYYYKAVISFKQHKLKESDAYIKLAEKKSPQLGFVKDKNLYFQFKRDLAEVIVRDSEFNKYKNKNYLVAGRGTPLKEPSKFLLIIGISLFVFAIVILGFFFKKKIKKAAMPRVPLKDDQPIPTKTD